jgi:hypothetical protein
MDRRYNKPGFSLFSGKRIASATLSVFLSAICLLPSGCSSSSDPEPEPEAKELKTSKDETSTDTPEAELVQLSKKLLGSSHFWKKSGVHHGLSKYIVTTKDALLI